MAKKKPVKKKKGKAAAKARRARPAKRKALAAKKPQRKKRGDVDSVTSGSEASTLDPKGQLIVETDEEASPGVHKGDLAGDLQGLSTAELFDSESVSELSEEGQDLEAELIEGIEEAPDPDQGEVQVHKAPRRRIPDYKDRNRI
jgi:hypothetical protein